MPDILYCWFIITLILPNILLSLTEPLSPLARLVNILLPLGIIALLASLSPRLGRTIWLMFPLSFLAAFQIVLLWLYGKGVIAVDMFLNLTSTNSGEVGELLGNLWPCLIIIALLYLPPLGCAVYLWRKNMHLSPGFSNIRRRTAIVLTALGTLALLMVYGTDDTFAASRNIFPLNAGYNACLAIHRSYLTANYDKSSHDYCYDAIPDDEEPRICMLIIGETSRAANWQLLGYDRATNPRLARRTGLFLFSDVCSESNTTHKSVPMLLSPTHASNFGQDIYKVKSLVTAFKEAGYTTCFVSNQPPNRSFIDFFANEADKTIRLCGADDSPKPDIHMLPQIQKLIGSTGGKLLIVVHCYGSHFNYRDRYEESDRHFLPDNYGEASASNRQALINAYDNTIVATDNLLDSFIGMLEASHRPATLLYTSDHGEDIFEDGRHFLHASPVPTFMQVHVPMLAWLSPQFRLKHAEVVNALHANQHRRISSSRSFMPTALSLGGISSPVLEKSASVALPDFSPDLRLYLNDHNEAVTLASMLKNTRSLL